MRHNYTNTILAAMLMFVAAGHIHAEKVKVDNISYNLNTETMEAEVTSGGSYSGDIVIPATITYNGEEYNVTSIGEDAFSLEYFLTSITIPAGVTTIGERALCYCHELTSITIPDGVTSIGESAFYECSSLSSVTSYVSEPCDIGSRTFGGISSNAVLYIPADTREKYESAGWTQYFASVVEMEANGVGELPFTEVRSDAVYDINGRRVARPARGLYIVNGKKVVVK